MKANLAMVDLLNNMGSAEVENFAKILSRGRGALSSGSGTLNHEEVYSLTDQSAPALAFRQFWLDNDISLIKSGNSKNFKIEPKDGITPPYVLKLEAWSAPSSINTQLNASPVLNALLAPVYANVKTKYGNVQVVPLYVGDLQALAQKAMPDEQRLKRALDIYQQMALSYESFRQAGIGFPDGKNANWLMDEHGKLYMTDTKSLLDAPNGEITEDLSHYRNYFMSIPEPGPYDVDKLHSLHLGKNLYQYLTGCHFTYLSNPIDPIPYIASNSPKGCNAADYDFSAPIFQTPIGQRLESLIKSMVKLDPQDRLSVADAYQELENLDDLLFLDALTGEAEAATAPIVPTVELEENHTEALMVINPIHDMKLKMREMRGCSDYKLDPIKSLILDTFQNALNDIVSLEDLKTFVETFKNSPSYAALAKQEPKDNDHSSEAYKVLDKIVDDRRNEIASRDNMNPLS